MNNIKEYDLLSWADNKDIKKIIPDEKIYYSDFLYKFSSFGLKQERIIILTENNFYYMNNKKITSKTPYIDILGITISKTKDEFIFHIKNEETDYHFLSKNRNIALMQLSTLYYYNTKNMLKICEVEQKNLKQYITNKKDKKKNPSFTKMDEKFLIDTKIYFNNTNEINEKELENDIIEKKKKVGTIFSNHDTIKNVGIDDFKLIKVIGRGSYGKVCLVQF